MSTATDTNAPAWMDKPPVRDSENTQPDWYQEFQKASWDRFQQLPIATRNDEDWRYADLKKSRFEKMYSIQSSDVTYTFPKLPLEKVVAKFCYQNGDLVESAASNLPDGVICAPIEEAIASGGDRLKDYFDLEAKRLGDEKFAALNGAASNYGLFVFVPKGIEVDGVITVQHVISGDASPAFPRTIVIAEDNSKVSVVETFHSANSDDPSLSIGVCDLHAHGGGKIRHTLIQDFNEHSKQIHLGTNHSGKDACIQSIILNLGCAWVRNESINFMNATGADTQVYGANLSNQLQEFDQRTLQIHGDQHTTSDLLFKNALYDKSRVIFGGLIQVLPGAHHTDSYQSCRNLLGSDQAEINAMPGLEIDADQVRCSHGATSGQISDEEIFYLRSRGIPTEEARRIVSCGFLNEAFDKVDDEKLVEWLAQMIEAKFDQIS